MFYINFEKYVNYKNYMNFKNYTNCKKYMNVRNYVNYKKYMNYVLREFQENILLLLKYKSSSSNTLQHLHMKKNVQNFFVLQKL